MRRAGLVIAGGVGLVAAAWLLGGTAAAPEPEVVVRGAESFVAPPVARQRVAPSPRLEPQEPAPAAWAIDGWVVEPDGAPLDRAEDEQVWVSGCGVARVAVEEDGGFSVGWPGDGACALVVSRVRGTAQSAGEPQAVDGPADDVVLVAPARPPATAGAVRLDELAPTEREAAEASFHQARDVIQRTLDDPRTSDATRARLEEIYEDLGAELE